MNKANQWLEWMDIMNGRGTELAEFAFEILAYKRDFFIKISVQILKAQIIMNRT